MNLLMMRKRAIARKKQKEQHKKEKLKRKLRKYLIKKARQGEKDCDFSNCYWYWNNTLSENEGIEILEELNERFKGQILFESMHYTFHGRVKIKEVEQECEK